MHHTDQTRGGWASSDPAENIVWDNLKTLANSYFVACELDPRSAYVSTEKSGLLDYHNVRENDTQFPAALNWVGGPIIVRPTTFLVNTSGFNNPTINLAKFYAELGVAISDSSNVDYQPLIDFANHYFSQMTSDQIAAWVNSFIQGF